MSYKEHHYAARALAILIIMFSLIYVGLLLDPSTPVLFNEYTLETNKDTYAPGDPIRVKIDYCSQKEQQVFLDFHLIDTVPVDGEDKPLLLRGPDLPWEAPYNYKWACEIIDVTAFTVNNGDYTSPYYIRGYISYRVNIFKWRVEEFESNEFFVTNDVETLLDAYDPWRAIVSPTYP